MLENNRLLAVLITLPLATTGAARAQAFDLSWNVVAGGGTASTGGTFTLNGTVGQPAASAANALTAGSYALTGGFWVATPPSCPPFSPADFNSDCVVSDADFLVFEACAEGADVLYNATLLPPGCTLTPDGEGHIAADFDKDGDVDQDDFGIFQRCYSGPNIPADPNCAQ